MYIIQPIVKAVKSGDVGKAKRLVEKIDVNKAGQHGLTPLMEVSRFIDSGEEVQTLIKVTELLLDAGADVNAAGHWGFTALVFAARDADDSHVGLVEFLIEKGANIGAKIKHGDDALSLAAECGKLSSVKALIKAGADIHATDYNDNTVLISCNADKCSAEMAKLLIDAGVDVNARNNEGRTALMNAAQYGNAEAVDVMIAAGADVNLKDRHDRTALMRAAEEVNLRIVKALVEAGADVAAKDRYGSGILAWAARFDYSNMSPESWGGWKKNRLATVKYLVETVGITDSENQWGETALFILEKSEKNNEVVRYLKKRRAKAS